MPENPKRVAVSEMLEPPCLLPMNHTAVKVASVTHKSSILMFPQTKTTALQNVFLLLSCSHMSICLEKLAIFIHEHGVPNKVVTERM